jgi:Fe-S-cluster containining protein
MSRLTHSQMDARLQALYDRIPKIPDCTGKCWTTCGIIGMSDRERQRIRQAGYKITPDDLAWAKEPDHVCEALTADKRCAVYRLRPLVCRLWGAVENLKCPFGCIPEGGWLSAEECYQMIVEAGEIGGQLHAIPLDADARRVMQSDIFKREMDMHMAVGNAGDQLRMQDALPPGFRRKAKHDG